MSAAIVGSSGTAAVVAERIIESQVKVVGPAAWKLAGRVKGMKVGKDHAITFSDAAEGDVIDRLVREYTSITGELGTRMCFMACADVLREHPELDVPCFRPFRRFS